MYMLYTILQLNSGHRVTALSIKEHLCAYMCIHAYKRYKLPNKRCSSTSKFTQIPSYVYYTGSVVICMTILISYSFRWSKSRFSLG